MFEVRNVKDNLVVMVSRALIGFLLMVISALGGFVWNKIYELPSLEQEVKDLSIKLDERYNDIKEKLVEEHYKQVNERDRAVSVTLDTMASVLSVQSSDLSAIKQQLMDAKAQERLDIERTNHKAETTVPDSVANIPVLGPLISSFGRARAKSIRHRGRQN